MSRLFKYIPVFVLWIAGIGLFGHMIMIHDHHSEAAFHYVPISKTDRPADLLSEAQLIALITGVS